MPIELSHIGERLIAGMLNRLAQRRELRRVTCAFAGHTLADDIGAGHLRGSLEFLPDVTLLFVRSGTIEYRRDGEQRVDVLCAGGARAIVFEAKLGETRMAENAFRQRFCRPCKKTSHLDPRLRGSMVAVLERSFPLRGKPDLVAVARGGDGPWTLVQPWWLVVRRSVIDMWRDGPPVSAKARVLDFDSLAAQACQTKREFDRMVMGVVGSGFAENWSVALGTPRRTEKGIADRGGRSSWQGDPETE